MTSFLFVFAIITVITPVYIVMRNGLDYITNFDLNQIKIFQNIYAFSSIISNKLYHLNI
jgi:hypothetical protein